VKAARVVLAEGRIGPQQAAGGADQVGVVGLQHEVARVGAEAVALVAEVGGAEMTVERRGDVLGVGELEERRQPMEGQGLVVQGAGGQARQREGSSRCWALRSTQIGA
jgi:hypothetical protein